MARGRGRATGDEGAACTEGRPQMPPPPAAGPTPGNNTSRAGHAVGEGEAARGRPWQGQERRIRRRPASLGSSWWRTPERRHAGDLGDAGARTERRRARGGGGVRGGQGRRRRARLAGAARGRPSDRSRRRQASRWRPRGGGARGGGVEGEAIGDVRSQIRPTATILGSGAASPAGPPAAATRGWGQGKVLAGGG